MEKWINLKMPSIERRKFQHSKNVLIFLKEKLDINEGEAMLEKNNFLRLILAQSNTVHKAIT